MAISNAGRPSRSLLLATIITVLAAGVLTGAQLGKIAPLVPWYRDGLGFSLVETGWLVALIGIFIAVAALPAGWAIDRIGLWRSVLAGSLALSGGGLLLALSSEPALIFAARLVEGIGYLALCIALPAVLNAVSPLAWKGPVLAIWSCFVPLGFATSDFLAPVLLPRFGAPVFLLTMAVLFAGLAAAALALLAQRRTEGAAGVGGGIGATLSRQVVLLAVGFGAFVVLSVSTFAFLPAYLSGEGAGRYLWSAGTIILAAPFGNLVAGGLVKGRGSRFMAGLAAAGFAVSVLAAVPAFVLQAPLAATALAVMLVMSGALVASALFAAIPFVTPARGSVSVAIGLVTQAGGIGTVAGPPVAALVIGRTGWTGFGVYLAAVALAGLAATLPLLRPAAGTAAVSAADARPIP